MMKTIANKIESGIRINENEALWLFQHADLAELGVLANKVNLRKNGKAVFYNINRHINPTNICSLSCKFCAYSKKIGEEGGYAYEIDEMISKASEAVAQGATELHMVGGLHPRWGFQRYVDMIAAIHKAFPQVHLKAFTAVELDWMARKSRKSISEVMVDLRNAGLGSFPGGGAEIFDATIRDQICETKVSGEQWIDTHRTAHKLGIRSNCTMLYGHIERYEHRVGHMRMLRELQDETNGFNVFIPLAFQPFQNEMGISRYTFGSDDLRTIAVARLYLDNFKHIKSYWVMLGQDIAQLALHFGANDLDGTVVEEKISRAAGGRAGMIMTRSNLENLIRRSGRTPVERTTLYHPVHSDDQMHLQPITDEDAPNDVAKFLQRLKNGSTLAPSDLWKTAVLAPLQTVIETKSLNDSAPKVSNLEQGVVKSWRIDLSQNGDVSNIVSELANISSNQLISDKTHLTLLLDAENVNTAIDWHSVFRGISVLGMQCEVVIRGLRSLFASFDPATESSLTYLSRLRDCGLTAVEESLADQDLELSAKWNLIQEVLESEIAFIPAMFIKTMTNGVDWSSWADSISDLRTRLSKTGLIYAINLRPNADGVIMPSEYMKALALTRLALPESISIMTPVDQWPTLSPQKGLGASDIQHPVMKLVSAMPIYGSSGPGIVPINHLSFEHIIEDIRAAGRIPTLMNIRGHKVDCEDFLNFRQKPLNHINCPI